MGAAPSTAVTGPAPRLLSELFADYKVLRETPGGAKHLLLSLVPVVAHRETVGEELDANEAATVEGIEQIIAHEMSRPDGRGRAVSRMLVDYLATLPGYQAASKRGDAAISADACEQHAAQFQRVPCLARAAPPTTTDSPLETMR